MELHNGLIYTVEYKSNQLYKALSLGNQKKVRKTGKVNRNRDQKSSFLEIKGEQVLYIIFNSPVAEEIVCTYLM